MELFKRHIKWLKTTYLEEHLKYWKKTAEIFKIYWALYGGRDALTHSPYLHVAIFISIIRYKSWSHLSKDNQYSWTQTTIDIIPSMLGFSMGGMAIMLAFSGERNLLKIISQDGKPDSLFAKIIASFFHFIFMQTIAILVALITQDYAFLILSFLGHTIFIYAILLGLATAGQILNISRVFNAYSSLKDGSDDEPPTH